MKTVDTVHPVEAVEMVYFDPVASARGSGHDQQHSSRALCYSVEQKFDN